MARCHDRECESPCARRRGYELRAFNTDQDQCSFSDHGLHQHARKVQNPSRRWMDGCRTPVRPRSQMRRGSQWRFFTANSLSAWGFAWQRLSIAPAQEGLWLHKPLRPGVQVHATLHSVAGRRPNGGHDRMLTETDDGLRRLFREGDPVHPYRGGKIYPRVRMSRRNIDISSIGT